MRVVKVVAEGVTTSFRYPHFMQSIQPSFEMPPPATIYGHICSALGEWFDPSDIRFAVHFSFEATFDDVEHVHVLTPARGTLPQSPVPKVLEGTTNPFIRRVLFRPRLTLYVNRPEWAERFRSPRYAVVLGRSQDLFTYTSVEEIELVQTKRAYLEHTLAPYWLARRTERGVVVLMPRFIEPTTARRATFARYVVLHRRVHVGEMLRLDGEPEPEFWTDPAAPLVAGDSLGLPFLSWVGDEGDGCALA